MSDTTNLAPTVGLYDGIDTADRSYAEQVVNADPVHGVPGPTTVKGHLQLPEKVTLASLSPAVADPIRAKLKTMTPASAQANLQGMIDEAVYNAACNVRVTNGLGSNATPYHRERYGIEHELRDMGAKHLKIAQELTEVVRWDNVMNPETGRMEPKAVEKVQGARRVALQQEMDLISYHMRLIENVEGPRRINEALKKTISEQKARAEEIEDAAEAERLAEKTIREERVAKLADAKVKMRRNRS